jgi:hypothetical protein
MLPSGTKGFFLNGSVPPPQWFVVKGECMETGAWKIVCQSQDDNTTCLSILPPDQFRSANSTFERILIPGPLPALYASGNYFKTPSPPLLKALRDCMAVGVAGQGIYSWMLSLFRDKIINSYRLVCK